jgi:hypothetical protein
VLVCAPHDRRGEGAPLSLPRGPPAGHHAGHRSRDEAALGQLPGAALVHAHHVAAAPSHARKRTRTAAREAVANVTDQALRSAKRCAGDSSYADRLCEGPSNRADGGSSSGGDGPNRMLSTRFIALKVPGWEAPGSILVSHNTLSLGPRPRLHGAYTPANPAVQISVGFPPTAARGRNGPLKAAIVMHKVDQTWFQPRAPRQRRQGREVRQKWKQNM